MEKRWRVLIADDQTIVREGLRALLENEGGQYHVVAEACDGYEVVRMAEQHKPDIVLLDLSMPKMNGLSAIPEIRRYSPDTKVLVLTVHHQEEYVLAVFQAGAHGYCLKDADKSEFMTAIKRVLSGKLFGSLDISERVLKGYLEGKKTQKPQTVWETLTSRERDVLKMIGEGYRTKEIAEFFCISPRTVKRHRANIMSKLNLHNTASLTSYAIDKGLVSR